MPPAGFESTIPASEPPWTAFDISNVYIQAVLVKTCSTCRAEVTWTATTAFKQQLSGNNVKESSSTQFKRKAASSVTYTPHPSTPSATANMEPEHHFCELYISSSVTILNNKRLFKLYLTQAHGMCSPQ
jgi:hypothetical protein